MRYRKKYIATLAAATIWLAVIIPAGTKAAAAGNPGQSVQVQMQVGQTMAQVNGQEVSLAVPPVIQEGTTLVPLRFVAEALGGEVGWDEASRSITVTRGRTTVQMTADQPTARVNGAAAILAVPPQIVSGTTLVPLRFIAEALGFKVGFVAETQAISLTWTNRPPVAQIELARDTVSLGDKFSYADASFDPDGDAIAAREWENAPPWPQPGNYLLTLKVQDEWGAWSEPVSRTIKVLPPPDNQPPVARFRVAKSTVAQGETVTYYDESYDPNGDALVEYQWEGNQRAFFAPGQYPVRLRVKDATGQWSQPAERVITVTDAVLMSELEYNLRYPLPGAKINIDGARVLDFPVQRVSWETGGPTLLLSNSPENVAGEGLLYADQAQGPVRLYFYHQNTGPSPLYFYVVAANRGEQPVNLEITRQGWAGPSPDPLTVGQRALLRYLDSQGGRGFVLQPGESAVINAAHARAVAPGQVSHGIYDLVSDNELEFAFVALQPGREPVLAWPDLRPLVPDNHPRGTFTSADRWASLEAENRSRLALGDGDIDPYAQGWDALDQRPAVNRGNYGLGYRLEIHAGRQTAVLTNPRGGAYAGAIADRDDVYLVPRNGFVAAGAQAAVNGVLEAGGKTDMFFLIPAGSSTPVNFFFLGEPEA